MSNHTPGPWEAKNWRVCWRHGGNIGVICDTAHNQQQRTDENKANARLIAAAPELLDAALRVTRSADGMEQEAEEMGWSAVETCRNALQRLRDAISKATGGPYDA